MSLDGKGQLPPEFFERLPLVQARIAAKDRQVPRWRWFWALYGTAFMAALCAACLGLFFEDWGVRIGNGLMILAGLSVIGAAGFHQLPILRVWVGSRESRR